MDQPIVVVFITILLVVFGLPAVLYLITRFFFLRDLELDVKEKDIDADLVG